MSEIYAVLGQAGTGKTTRLMSQASELAPRFLTADHHRLLAITRMHGARRRLEAKLKESCLNISCDISTIDSFALSIVSRWRTTFGCRKPVVAVQHNSDFVETEFWVEADFQSILSRATDLLKSPTVGKIIRASYPMVMIDEFQDCHGSMLELVQHLVKTSCLLLAADDFQFLNDEIDGCPAVEWIEGLASNGRGRRDIEETNHRTSESAMLRAAECLRTNTKSREKTIPVISCPNAKMAGWKIADALSLRFYEKNWSDGDCAVIFPSHDVYVKNVMNACADYSSRYKKSPLTFHEEIPPSEHVQIVLQDIGFEKYRSQCIYDCTTTNAAGRQVIECVQEQVRLRGLSKATEKMVISYAERIIHYHRAFSPKQGRRVMLTVHGAKNREFDNVIVVWPYKVNEKLKRRLLYNAITRAKKHCMVLLQLKPKDAEADSAISLLGPLEPFSDSSKKKRQVRSHG